MGIAQSLIQMTIKAGIEAGCDSVMVLATSHRTQRMFDKKFGFETIKTIVHSEYLNENGEPILKCRDGNTICGKTMISKNLVKISNLEV